MQLFSHGAWSRYTPNPLPAGFPLGVMYSKRVSDGLDWYVHNHDTTAWTANSIKMVMFPGTSGQWVVGQSNRDATMLFPQDGTTILEITDDVGTNDPKQYMNMIWDGATSLTAPPAPAPTIPPISRHQMLIALMNANLITTAEAIAAASTGAMPSIVANYVNTLPTAQQPTAQVRWAGMTVCARNDAFMIAVATFNNISSTQIDSLFAAAKAV